MWHFCLTESAWVGFIVSPWLQVNINKVSKAWRILCPYVHVPLLTPTVFPPIFSKCPWAMSGWGLMQESCPGNLQSPMFFYTLARYGLHGSWHSIAGGSFTGESWEIHSYFFDPMFCCAPWALGIEVNVKLRVEHLSDSISLFMVSICGKEESLMSSKWYTCL